MKNLLIKLFLGVEISKENFRIQGILALCIMVGFAYVIFFVFDLFGIIDNLLTMAQLPWYSFYLTKFSFLMIFIKIIFLSLFTTKNDPTARFVAAFVTQFCGLVGMLILLAISDFSQGLTSDPQIKTLIAIIPFVLGIIISITIRGIYRVDDFKLGKFFNPVKKIICVILRPFKK